MRLIRLLVLLAVLVAGTLSATLTASAYSLQVGDDTIGPADVFDPGFELPPVDDAPPAVPQPLDVFDPGFE